MRRSAWFLAMVSVLFSGSVCVAGRIVVANDDWTLSDRGFAAPNDADRFARNVVAWFTGGAAGDFLVYSDHFGLTGASLRNAITSAGHTWTVDTSTAFNLSTLLAYDGVFLGVTPAGNGVLTDYVNAGGNVYVMSGGNADDPPMWNHFLETFGLAFGDQNSFVGDIPIGSSHALFAGVDHLYNINGTSILDLAPWDPRNQLLVNHDGQWIYAAYESGANAVPVPGAVVLGVIGCGVAAGLRRRLF